MQLEFHQVDAFASKTFEGNQACVMPLDAFLHMPRLGRLTETMMGGGVIAQAASIRANGDGTVTFDAILRARGA